MKQKKILIFVKLKETKKTGNVCCFLKTIDMGSKQKDGECIPNPINFLLQ